jgi:2-C-methyl-D-erythritol 2,4-cyclodiphosphate synthase
VGNADVAVVAERHKVGPHRAAMRERLAARSRQRRRVFVKGKTNEGLGALGAGDGLAAHAVVALVRAPARDAYDA